MMRGYARFIVGIVALAIVCVGLALATFPVSPSESVLVLRGGKVVAEIPTPGLHWKIPLLESIVRLDTRTQLSEGRVRLVSDDAGGLAIGYSIIWRIDDAERFYKATGGDDGAVRNRLSAALVPVLRREMAAGSAKDFLTRPASAFAPAVAASVKPIAEKIGIVLIAVNPGTADIPQKLSKDVAQKMAAVTASGIEAAKSAGEAERNAIAGKAAAKREAMLSEAQRKAAKIGGESQARVVAIYEQVAGKAPEFFRYFLALESESAALKSHTRVFVISTDSPWFEALQKTGGKH